MTKVTSSGEVTSDYYQSTANNSCPPIPLQWKTLLIPSFSRKTFASQTPSLLRLSSNSSSSSVQSHNPWMTSMIDGSIDNRTAAAAVIEYSNMDSVIRKEEEKEEKKERQ